MEVPTDLKAEDVDKMKVSELKAELTKQKSSTQGTKTKLASRLKAILKAKAELAKAQAEEDDEEEVDADEDMEAADEEAADDGPAEFTVADDFTEGTVALWKGTYGFINIGEDKGLFCHKDDIETSDRHGCLRKNMLVRCKIAEYTSGKKKGQKFAQSVQQRDGSPVTWFANTGEGDLFEREPLGDKVYEGTVKFFNFKKKYGLIKPDETIEVGEGDDKIVVSEEGADDKKDCIYVGWHDIVTDDVPPGLKKDMKVQFTLYKDKQGLGCSDVAQVGGDPIVRQDTRNKNWKPDSEERFSGTVKFFKVNGFGFITPNEKQADGEAFKYNENMFKGRLFINPNDIVTDSSPAFLEQDQEVEFSVEVKDGELQAKNITLPGGDKVVTDPEKNFQSTRTRSHERHLVRPPTRARSRCTAGTSSSV